MDIISYVGSVAREIGRAPVIGLVGAGTSSLAVAKKLSGSRILLRDRSLSYELGAWEGIPLERVILGADYLSDITEDLLLLSPSVRRDHPSIKDAEIRGVRVASDAEIFFRDSHRRVYAVTGSDGKSTTATLSHLLLSECHPCTELLGNIGTPFASSEASGYAVAELSSFQLCHFTPSPYAALITGITPNHLDWHKSYGEYIDAKLNIFEGARHTVISPDTPECDRIARSRELSVVYSIKYSQKELKERYCAEHFISHEGGYITVDGERIAGSDLCRRREAHNIHNLMGAMALTLGEYSAEHLRSVAKSFPGLPHRMEIIRSASGIEFINSSIDTTPARTRATMLALCKRVRIILGGRGKGLNLSPCIEPLLEYAARISLYGEVAKEYYRELEAAGITARIECRIFEDFDSALRHATLGATNEDTVLLSPAATGYGEFKNFAERGIHFMEYVRNL